MLIWLTWLSTGLSVGAIVGLILVANRPNRRDGRLLELELELDMAVSSLKKLHGKVARQTQLAEQDLPAEPATDNHQRPGESDLAWKRRLRAKIAAGTLQHR